MKVNDLALRFENLTKTHSNDHNPLEVKNIKNRYDFPITKRLVPQNNCIDVGIKLSPEEREKKIAFKIHLNNKLKTGPQLKQKVIEKRDLNLSTDLNALNTNPDTSSKTLIISGVIPPPPPLPTISLIPKKKQWVKIDGKQLDKENKEKVKNKAAEHFNAGNYVESKAKATNSSKMMDELKAKLLARNLKEQT